MDISEVLATFSKAKPNPRFRVLGFRVIGFRVLGFCFLSSFLMSALSARFRAPQGPFNVPFNGVLMALRSSYLGYIRGYLGGSR